MQPEQGYHWRVMFVPEVVRRGVGILVGLRWRGRVWMVEYFDQPQQF